MAIHRYKVDRVRTTIDTSAPSTLALRHLRKNSKGLALELEKQKEIARDNDFLLTRMQRMRGESFHRETPFRPSLNYRVRKAREMEIRKQNKLMVQRLRASKSIVQNVKPMHFHPRSLPPLDFNESMISQSARTRGEEVSPSSSTPFSKSFLSARTQDSRSNKKSLPKLLDSLDQDKILIRDAFKCRGKYVVATIAQRQGEEDFWDVDFYVPEDAATYTAPLSIEQAASWLGIDKGEIAVGRATRKKNQDSAQRNKRKKAHLQTLLRCYDISFDGDKVPRLTHDAVDAAYDQFAEDQATSSIFGKDSAVEKKTTIGEASPPLSIEPLQLALQEAAQKSSTEIENFLRRYESSDRRSGEKILTASVLKKMIRSRCSSSTISDSQLSSCIRQLSSKDSNGNTIVRVNDILALFAGAEPFSDEGSLFASGEGSVLTRVNSEVTQDTTIAKEHRFHRPGHATKLSNRSTRRQLSSVPRQTEKIVAPYTTPPTNLIAPRSPRNRKASIRRRSRSSHRSATNLGIVRQPPSTDTDTAFLAGTSEAFTRDIRDEAQVFATSETLPERNEPVYEAAATSLDLVQDRSLHDGDILERAPAGAPEDAFDCDGAETSVHDPSTSLGVEKELSSFKSNMTTKPKRPECKGVAYLEAGNTELVRTPHAPGRETQLDDPSFVSISQQS